jgi:hypothetical protein
VSRRLIYASFWGRLWRNAGPHADWAAAVARSLTDHWARSGDGAFVQSSFYIDEGWYDGARATDLSTKVIIEAIQLLIDRGVIAETNDRDEGSEVLLIVFLEETLSLAGGSDAAGASRHGSFATTLGNTFSYGIVASGAAAGEDLVQRLAATAEALVVAMCATPGPHSGPGEIDPARVADAGAVNRAEAENDRPAHPNRMLPLPSVYVAARVPRFQLNDQEMERYVARLALPPIHGSAAVLKHASALIDARIAERATGAITATKAELRDFGRPHPRVPTPERLTGLRSTLRENDPEAALVAQILTGVSEPAFARMRRLYFNDDAFKFIDTVYWTYHKLRLAKRLGLDTGPARSIWDIGCGGGHFSRVCRHFGHRIIGTDIAHPVYADIAAALGVERTIDALEPDTPTTDFGRKFDLVCAAQVEFDRVHIPDKPSRYWTLDNWKYLFNDLIARQLSFPARIYIYLNFQTHDGAGSFDLELLRLCARHGADANERRGTIDWKLDAPVTV